MLRLHLLGAPAIRNEDHHVHLPSQKAQALLFYLAAEAGRGFARGQLIALLWEESSEREGRNSLSTVLTRLRQALPLFPLRAEGDTLAWQTSAEVWVDLHAFQALARAPAGEGAEQRVRRLEQAAALYRGPFLDGFALRDGEAYEEWLRLERERWEQRALNTLEHLIEAYTAVGAWAPAIEQARRAIVADPLQERFHRALMRLHFFAGDRAAALSQFRACREILDRELGVEPDPETLTLHQQLLDGTLERPQLRRPRTDDREPPADDERPQHAALSAQHAALSTRSPRLGDRLASARQRSFVGRSEELALFAGALAQEEPPFAVLHVYGAGGVGKSALLGQYARLCAEAGVPVFQLDGRAIQPTPDSVRAALREAVGAEDPLEVLPERCALLVDTYELLAPIDTWLRDHLMPRLPGGALVVLAGRNALPAAWRVDPAWQEMARSLRLDNLSDDDVGLYLQRRQVPEDQREAVQRFCRGYPLALSLAAEVLLQRPGASFESTPPPDVVRALLERFVTGVPSLAHRAALEACSQVRAMSEPLLAAMLDTPDPREVFEWLRDLSFVSAGARGLFLHDLAREAVATDLKWRNPRWHEELHRRARRHYMAEFESGHPHAQHQALLDLIYLHDSPVMQAIFTWSEVGGLVEDTPRAADLPALLEMVRAHEGEASARLAAAYFARQPESVAVFRNDAGEVTGFTCFVTLRPDEAPPEDDPCALAVQRHLRTLPPLEDGQVVAVQRYWMDREAYQGVSPTQGMIFVTSARYVLTTPRLAHSFHVHAFPDAWAPVLEQVLFEREPAADFTLDGRTYGVFTHNWRACPPQRWLELLAEREIEA
ncbi:MAG TPA: BTAD domain-containing putative transcriptional regulator [Roseiflexaceae bacterium]|nr:BTAD domain-containing putative transcriptional regulator [Roseiflexaceae bacterium]